MISFVMLRYGLSFVATAKSLNAWDGDNSAAHLAEIHAARLRREREQAELAAQREAERRGRLELRDEIHLTARIQRDTRRRLSELLKGSRESYPGETETSLAILASAEDDLRITEAEYMRAAGLEA